MISGRSRTMILVDTNVVIDVFDQRPDLGGLVPDSSWMSPLGDEQLAINDVVYAELSVGYGGSKKSTH